MDPSSTGLAAYFTWPWILFGLLVIAGTAALVTGGILYLERQRRRDQRATEIQADLVDALNSEFRNKGAAVRPTVQLAARHRYTVELVGGVGSPDIQAAVRRLVDRHMSRVSRSFEILDRLEITGPSETPTSELHRRQR